MRFIVKYDYRLQNTKGGANTNISKGPLERHVTHSNY